MPLRAAEAPGVGAASHGAAVLAVSTSVEHGQLTALRNASQAANKVRLTYLTLGPTRR